ncbi:MAG: Cd(II)/Pb(II)-responsive transcriptional regulator [Oxalobacter formigenes]|nr:Cd(II)/Pb(II)-responsive transcriptional regulator [Oxalobacter formigenes]
MKIGELAQATGTQVETIRYYEREGLLPESRRTNSNYRIYSKQHMERLLFIRRCRTLDMTLNEIRALLHFNDAEEDNCHEVNALLDEHISHVAGRIRELRKLEKQLRDLRKYCRCREMIRQSGQAHNGNMPCLCKAGAPHCGILTELFRIPAGEIPKQEAHNHVPGSHIR